MIARSSACVLICVSVMVSAASFACALGQSPAASANAPVASAPATQAQLPVREVTVFKDGHAFVLRESELAAGAGNEVVLDDLPAPVLGAFWPYANGGAKLVSAKAAKQRVKVERTALELRALLAANIGCSVNLYDIGNEVTSGTIVDVPKRSTDELERVEAPSGTPRVPVAGAIVLVRTSVGTRAIPLDRVRDVTFLGEHKTMQTDEELRDRLTLRVERSAGAAGEHAKIGLVYVQKGLRWIPAYKLDIDGAGKAAVELEATLVNDLVELVDATVNLVIGVPHFEFAGMVDPIALQETAASLGRRMQERDRMSNFLSNSIMTQAAEYMPSEPSPNDAPSPAVEGGENNEDLFVFTVRHVTLGKGERLVLPIASFTLDYRDVYTLDVPFAPPAEMRDNFQSDRMNELAKMLSAPKAMHALRLTNKSAAPLTTAPALVLNRGRVIAQGLMTYTPIGTDSDLPMTTAVDVCVEKTEKESGRTQNAVKWGSDSYHRIDMTGAIELINKKTEAVAIEVRRSLMGLVDSVDSGGTFEQKSLSEEWFAPDRPIWWSWWSWPSWWQHWNGTARATWKLTLKPGETVTLNATWHYFWR